MSDKTSDWKPDLSDAAYTSMRDGCYAGWEDFARALYSYNRAIDKRFDLLADELTATKRKLASAEARVKELEVELSQSFELAEGQLSSEKLAGNIVKEEFWKGELAALRRMKQSVAGKA